MPINPPCTTLYLACTKTYNADTRKWGWHMQVHTHGTNMGPAIVTIATHMPRDVFSLQHKSFPIAWCSLKYIAQPIKICCKPFCCHILCIAMYYGRWRAGRAPRLNLGLSRYCNWATCRYHQCVYVLYRYSTSREIYCTDKCNWATCDTSPEVTVTARGAENFLHFYRYILIILMICQENYTFVKYIDV